MSDNRCLISLEELTWSGKVLPLSILFFISINWSLTVYSLMLLQFINVGVFIQTFYERESTGNSQYPIVTLIISINIVSCYNVCLYKVFIFPSPSSVISRLRSGTVLPACGFLRGLQPTSCTHLQPVHGSSRTPVRQRSGHCRRVSRLIPSS